MEPIVPTGGGQEAAMSLSIEIRRVDQAVILGLSGRLSVLEQQLRQLAWKLIEGGERNLIISLANVSYLDNSGLGQLCWIYTVSRNRGGDMKLLRPTPRIKRLLNITKLDTVFQSFDFESDAIQSMQPLKSAVSG
jgi:anti-sigma B factor antagonist